MFAMSKEDQIVVPPSLVMLFVEELGRVKPNASHQHVLARYEFCGWVGSVP
jgi:hypothetical protein